MDIGDTLEHPKRKRYRSKKALRTEAVLRIRSRRNSSNQKARSTLKDRGSHVREAKYGYTCIRESVCIVAGCPTSVRGLFDATALLLVSAPAGPIVPGTHYRHYHEFQQLLRLCCAVTKMAAPVHPTVQRGRAPFGLILFSLGRLRSRSRRTLLDN